MNQPTDRKPLKLKCIAFWFYDPDPSAQKLQPVWPWRFGWEHSQSFESFYFGPGYIRWGY